MSFVLLGAAFPPAGLFLNGHGGLYLGVILLGIGLNNGLQGLALLPHDLPRLLQAGIGLAQLFGGVGDGGFHPAAQLLMLPAHPLEPLFHLAADLSGVPLGLFLDGLGPAVGFQLHSGGALLQLGIGLGIGRKLLQLLLKALVFIEANEKALYLREASLLIYGDSKYLEENTLGPVCRALRDCLGRPCGELELEDERKIDVTSLFLRRRYSNYAIHEEFVNAIKECIKHIPPKRKPKIAEKKQPVTPKIANSGSPAKETKKPQEIPNDWKEKYDLAVMYEEGAPEKRNPEAALAIYQELAETGIPLAQWRLARFYKSGTAVEKNIQKAVEWFTKAAEQGNVQAMDALGNIYSSLGKKEWKADNSKSLYWWTQAAQRGNARAQFNLSIYYNTIQQDFSQRLYWLNEAAKNGHDIAQNALGELYLDGDGVKKDYRIAAYWFGQSAKNGYAHGQYSLGICYANGIGVEQSTANARYWFEAAAKQGHKYAAKELKRLR